MFNLIIFPVIFFFLNTSPLPVKDTIEQIDNGEEKEIYLIKQNWHTAIVINVFDIHPEFMNELNLFGDFSVVDFGWGDEEFYQYYGFDSGLAFKALFYRTPSTLRVEEVMISKESYFTISEIVIKITVTEEQLNSILSFINNTLYRDKNGNPEILSERVIGRIKFFKAVGDYHLFNTCNTWIAECLVNAGINIEDNIILTEQLFKEAEKIGEVLKVREK